jgi:hypothetical protein
MHPKDMHNNNSYFFYFRLISQINQRNRYRKRLLDNIISRRIKYQGSSVLLVNSIILLEKYYVLERIFLYNLTAIISMIDKSNKPINP